MTRGKCRHCSVSVNDRPGWWVAEDGRGEEPGECPAAPPVLDPQCDGTGAVVDTRTGDPVRCWACEGTGRVPGPHWPWRHPSPI